MSNPGTTTFASRVAGTLLAAVTIALCGCASQGFGFSNQSYLYNAEKDKQGQTALKAANDVKLTAAIDAVEKRNAKLLELEIEAARTRYANIRELEIREVAFSDKPLKETWLARIDSRFKAIYGTGNNQAALKAQRDLRTEERILATIRNAFEVVARPAPECSYALANERLPQAYVDAVPERLRPNLVPAYAGLRVACTAYEDKRKQYDAALRSGAERTGALAKALAQMDADVAERDKAMAARRDAQRALKEAQDAFAEATKNLLPSETNYAEKVAAAVQKLTQAVKAVEGAQKGLNEEIVAKERLAQIEEILKAVAGGEVDTAKWDPELRKAVAIAGTLPALADEASRMLREAARPRLVPFELARQQQQLIVEEAEKTNAVLATRVDASTRIVVAYAAEGAALASVREQVERWSNDSLDKVMGNPEPRRKREVYEVLGVYFDDVPRFQLEQRLWQARRLGTQYDEVIIHSRYAALQWQNLNTGIAATLAGYHGSGIKPETIAEFLKALGIILIGVGVN